MSETQEEQRPASPTLRAHGGAEPAGRPAAAVDAPLPEGVPSNAELLLPYLLPYGAYVGVAALGGGLGHAADYAIRIVATTALLLHLRHRLGRLRGPRPVAGSAALGLGAGLLGVPLWIVLVAPFRDAGAGAAFAGTGFALRLLAATLLVPLAEELLFRGYLLGLVTQWQEARRARAPDPLPVALDRRSVHLLAPGAGTVLAAVVSSAAFALGHAPAEYAAAFAYGLLMAGLRIRRGDLVAPVVAHGATNLALYLYVLRTGSWGLW